MYWAARTTFAVSRPAYVCLFQGALFTLSTDEVNALHFLIHKMPYNCYSLSDQKKPVCIIFLKLIPIYDSKTFVFLLYQVLQYVVYFAGVCSKGRLYTCCKTKGTYSPWKVYSRRTVVMQSKAPPTREFIWWNLINLIQTGPNCCGDYNNTDFGTRK